MPLPWFSPRDLPLHPRRRTTVDGMRGISLPHAGTRHCGHVLAHALRFVPPAMPTRIVVVYQPVSPTPNVLKEHTRNAHRGFPLPAEHAYHEALVPVYAMCTLWPEVRGASWAFVNVNAREPPPPHDEADTEEGAFVVVSCDWSHHLPMNEAMPLEDRAVVALQHGKLDSAAARAAMDSVGAFKVAQQIRPNPGPFVWQWVGRSRSGGERGVGYLAFLLRRTDVEGASKYFVSAYDEEFRLRECLGTSGTSGKNPTQAELRDLMRRVARSGSRARPRLNRDLGPGRVPYLTVTAMYDDEPAPGAGAAVVENEFIRGWHSVSACGATYVASVFLKHVFEGGGWIHADATKWHSSATTTKPDTEKDAKKDATKKGKWSFGPTLRRLARKAGGSAAAPACALESVRLFETRAACFFNADAPWNAPN